METTVTGQGSLLGAMKKVMAPQESALSNIEKNTAETRNTLAKSIVKIEKNTNPVTANKGLKGFFKNMFGKSAEAEMEGKKKAKKDGEEESKFRKFMKEKWGAVAENKKAIAFGGLLKKIFMGLLAGFAIFALPKDFWVGIGNALLSLGKWLVEIDWKGVFTSIKDTIISVKDVINEIINGIFGKEEEGKEKRQGGFLGQGGDLSGFLSFFGIDGDEVSSKVSKFVAGLGLAVSVLAIAFPMTAIAIAWKIAKGMKKLSGKLGGKAIDLLGGGKEGMAQRSMTPEQIKMSQDRAKAYADNAKKAGPRVGKPSKGGGGWFKALMGKLGKFGKLIKNIGVNVVKGLMTMGPWGWGILLAVGAGLLIYSYWEEISTGFANVGKFLKDGVKSLINKFKSFNVSAIMEKMIRGVPLVGDSIADFMFGSGASKKADIKKEREEGYGKEFVHKTPEERKKIEKERRAQEDKKKTTGGATTAAAKGDVKGIESEIESLNNEWSTLGTTQVDKQRAAEIGKKLNSLRSQKTAIMDSQEKTKSVPLPKTEHSDIGGGGDTGVEHEKVAVSNANMSKVSWNKIGGRENIESAITGIWNKHGIKQKPTFTSGFRGQDHFLTKANPKSQHPKGTAFDLRSANIPTDKKGAVFADLRASFGKGIWGQHEIGKVNKGKRTGEHFHFQAAAQGFQGVVDKATIFLVGEGGAEMVNVTPLRSPQDKTSAINSLQNENAAGKMGNNAPTIINNAPQTINNSGGGGETYLPLPATVKHDKFDI